MSFSKRGFQEDVWMGVYMIEAGRPFNTVCTMGI